MSEQQPALNTDREIWRGKSRAEFGDPDRFYADSIFVTANGEGIGMNCGGYVIVKPLREWFALARPAPAEPQPDAQWLRTILLRSLPHAQTAIMWSQILEQPFAERVQAAEQRATRAALEAAGKAQLEIEAMGKVARLNMEGWEAHPVGIQREQWSNFYAGQEAGLRMATDILARALSATAQTPSEPSEDEPMKCPTCGSVECCGLNCPAAPQPDRLAAPAPEHDSAWHHGITQTKAYEVAHVPGPITLKMLNLALARARWGGPFDPLYAVDHLNEELRLAAAAPPLAAFRALAEKWDNNQSKFMVGVNCAAELRALIAEAEKGAGR